MKLSKFGILAVLTLLVVAAPALAGDCIKMKNGKFHQPGPGDGASAPSREDYDNSPYVVLEENYDKVEFSMKLPNGKTTKQTLDTDKVDTVFYWPQPQAFSAAASLMGAGDYAGAVERFQAVADDRAQRFWAQMYALMNIALIHEAGGNWQGAQEAWEELVKKFPKSRYVPKAYIQIGLAHMNLGDANSAKASFGRLSRLSGLPEGQKALAQYYMILIKQKQGEATRSQSVLSEALAEYRSLLGKTESDPEMREVAILSRLGIGTCLLGLGQFDEALAFFQKIADSATDKAVLAGAYNGLGDCYYKKNEWKNALLAYLRVEVLYDEIPEQTARALFYAGKCFHFMSGAGVGEDSKARAKAQYGKCASRFPGTSWAQQAREASASIR